MEFPETGKRCSMKVCQLLDFLPFVCEHCQATFCKEHFHMVSHKCLKMKSSEPNLGKPLSFVCSKESCKEVSPIQMPCVKCKQHFCLAHRFHGCLELSETNKTQLKKWQIPKKQFAEAKALVDQQISDNLKKSKNTAMANKVQLMRVKGSAIGPKNVPVSERCYFLVHLPLTVKNKHIGTSKGAFVNSQWTIGKCIDSMADTLKVPNNNNAAITNKLRLYHHSNGALICNEMDTPLAKLFENSTIVDGQRVVLEYSDDVSIETSLYK